LSSIRTPITIRCHGAASWIAKASTAAKRDPDDLDAQFIFYWIAFNALYGQPKYLDDRVKEWKDIEEFLRTAIRLGKSEIGEQLRDIKHQAQAIIEDPFLIRDSWKQWHQKKILDKAGREKTRTPHWTSETSLHDLFSRLYVLHNQLFHGCSTDGGSKNRESLEPAVAVLGQLIPLFRNLVREHGEGEPFLDTLPYPPSEDRIIAPS